MNYNVSRNGTGKSQLDKIERAYLKSLNVKTLTAEQLEQIEAALVTNPNMLDHPEMYSGLEQVKAEFQLLKASVLDAQASLTDSYVR